MTDPYVSIIIPTFNRKKVLKRSIESVINQTYTNIEIIIVDDGSTDNTDEMVKKINDQRIKYIRLIKNSGPARARNKGVEAARGEYVAFQDSDDFWVPEKLEKQINFLRDNPKYDFVFCKIISQGDRKILIPPEESFDITGYEYGFLDVLIISNKIGTPAMMMKKTLFEKLGGFNPNFRTMEDWDLALRVAEHNQIGFVNDILVEATPSSEGVNTLRGESSIEVAISILSRYWGSHKNKKIFENLISLIVLDTEKLDKEKQYKYLLMLDNIVPRSYYISLIEDYKYRLDKANLQACDNQKNADNLSQGLKNERKHVQDLEASLENEQRHVIEIEASLKNEQKHVKELEASLENEQKHVAELETSLGHISKHESELEAVVANDQLVIENKDQQIETLKKQLSGE